MAKGASGKKVGQNEAESRILEYLRKTNRPYSAIDVFNNLRQEIPKATVQKLLISLSESNEITCKHFGKQQVYVARQDVLDTPSIEELEVLDQQIGSLKESVVGLKESVKAQSGVLHELTSALTDDQIRERLSVLEKENAKYEDRLARLREGAELLDEKERMAIEQKYEENRKQWRLRKKMVKSILDMIAEGADVNPKKFMEQLDLEDDEAVGDVYEQDYLHYMDDK